MKVPKRFAVGRTTIFRPELDACPTCGGSLTFRHIAWKKHIIRLDGLIYAVCHAHACPACSRPIYRSAQAEDLALKHGTFGMDVMVRAGRLRYHEHLTRQETQVTPRKLRIPISERHVQSPYEAHLIRLGCDAHTTRDRLTPPQGACLA